MHRNRAPSGQAVKVLRALAADPARWRYGYDLTAEVHLKSDRPTRAHTVRMRHECRSSFP